MPSIIALYIAFMRTYFITSYYIICCIIYHQLHSTIKNMPSKRIFQAIHCKSSKLTFFHSYFNKDSELFSPNTGGNVSIYKYCNSCSITMRLKSCLWYSGIGIQLWNPVSSFRFLSKDIYRYIVMSFQKFVIYLLYPLSKCFYFSKI